MKLAPAVIIVFLFSALWFYLLEERITHDEERINTVELLLQRANAVDPQPTKDRWEEPQHKIPHH